MEHVRVKSFRIQQKGGGLVSVVPCYNEKGRVTSVVIMGLGLYERVPVRDTTGRGG